MIRLALIWGVLAGAAVASDASTLARFEAHGVEMAVPIRVVLYSPDAQTANRATEALLTEVRRQNGIFSDYNPASEARRLCDRADYSTPLKVSGDLFQVLLAAQGLSEQSAGAFDVTVGPLTHLWRRTIRRGVLPSSKRLDEARSQVGYKLVKLDPEGKTVALLKPGMRLDFGGIAKGYALDRAMDILRREGITRTLIQFGGDIRLGDPPPGKSGWRIGIGASEDRSAPLYFVTLRNVAVATSGDASQFVEINGRRYSHIIHPQSGLGLTDRDAVTVIAPRSILADALSTTVSVLGPTEGLKLAERLPETAVLIVRTSDGRHQMFASERMKRLMVPDAML
ncbi:MAG TPA: FAD:protein FMN transferase [Thermoguttaceae bacterium]|nr:FAD:protein FMN transferase [Thermoguttaceae bacterium]